ncbi:MAG: hypothetical protein NTW86_16310 [Candidatus Sumerlaeota bacterium]|nr:hypothetical protein [Candidatus Sumerlaeota bacterium]
MDRNYVIARIDEWENRLDGLYFLIDGWFQELPDPNKQIFVGSVLQRDEPLMKQYDVPPRMLPTRAILCGKKRISFTPSTLWVIGADGRVNVATNEHQFALVDMRNAQDQPSDWRIVASRLRDLYLPFDQQAFLNLVLQEAVEAA